MTGRVRLIRGYLFGPECYKVEVMGTIFCHECEESEKAGPWMEVEEAGVQRQQLPNAVSLREKLGGDAGSRWLHRLRFSFP